MGVATRTAVITGRLRSRAVVAANLEAGPIRRDDGIG